MKPIVFGVFENAQVNDSGTANWRHPDNERLYFDRLAYWNKIASTCEKGGVDFLFLADAWGWSEIAGERPSIASEESLDLPRLDPAIVIASLIQQTTNLGLVMTGSTLLESPYAFVRRLATIDHLSKGRLGWNVVTTGTAETALAAFGQEMMAHDDRYDMADDFMELAYKLFEGAWEPSAIERNRQHRFADPSKVHRVIHDGPYFKCTGFGNTHYSPQGTPVIFQAGSSPRGIQFAGRHAECVFIGGGPDEYVANQVHVLREEAKVNGRDPKNDIKILCAISTVVGETEADAKRKLESIAGYHRPEVAVASFAMFTGIDLSNIPQSMKMSSLTTELSQTQIQRFGDATVSDVLNNWHISGARPKPITGTPSQIADVLMKTVQETDIDGFVFVPIVQSQSTSEFVDLIMPLLTQTKPTTRKLKSESLRERLMTQNSPYLADRHPGAGYRR